MIRNYEEWKSNYGVLSDAGLEASILINEYDTLIGYAERNRNGFCSEEIRRHFALWLEARANLAPPSTP